MTPRQAAVSEFAADGMTINEIAVELDVSYDAVRSAKRRAGVTVMREDQRTVRSIAGAMKPLEAFEYLLGVIEESTPIFAESHPLDRMALALTGQERRFLICLFEAHGRTVVRESLYRAIYAHELRGGETNIKILDVLASRIRKKIDGTSMRVVSHRGQGLSLDRVST